MEKIILGTSDLTSENIDNIGELFPQVITEAFDDEGNLKKVIDFDALRQELSGELVEGAKERYQFTWPGKQAAKLEARRPISKTLRPSRDESMDFDTTENLYIEGDNLDALKLLRNTYAGKIKMIYIDPPYNTGSDLIYNDDFSTNANDYAEQGGDFDEGGSRLVANLTSNGRFHSDWCSMMYPRLLLAKDLLRKDGLLFISIDDGEIQNLRKLCDETFGENSFIVDLIWEKRYTRNNDAKLMSTVTDHILLYRKSDAVEKLREPRTEKQNSTYSNPDNDLRGVWTSVLFTSQRTKEERPNLSYPIVNPITEEIIEHPTNAWKYSKVRYEELERDGRLYWGVNGGNSYPRIKRFLSELDDGVVPINLWYYKDTATLDEGTKLVDSLLGKDVFDYPKPIQLIQRMINIANDDQAIILDFFSGSASTAHAVLQANSEDEGHRKFIMVQLPEDTSAGSAAHNAGYHTIAEIGKERIRRAGTKIKEEAGLLGQNLDIGFRVLKIDDSNFEDTYRTPDETEQTSLAALAGNLKFDCSPEDLLFEVLPAFRIPLSAKIETISINNQQVFNVNDNHLLACFDIAVTTEVVEAIAKLKPVYAVFRDASFANDSTAANFEELFKTYSPDTVRKVV